MSRTNPGKKKRRAAGKTILVYGEGLSEEVFLKHLRSLYSFNTNVAVTIRRGKGGTADGLVLHTSRALGAFSRRCVLLDNDKGKSEMKRARALCVEKKMEIFENFPCLEAILLSILSNGASFSSKSSPWCKKEFESKHISGKNRGNLDMCKNKFPKSLLDRMRSKVPELNALIKLMEGK